MQGTRVEEEFQGVHKVNRRFTKQEDYRLIELVQRLGENRWNLIARYMQNRNARQCKDRWNQYLSPNTNNTPWTQEEEEKLKRLYVELGGKWYEIAKRFNGRADSQIRNKWRTLLRRNGQYFPKSTVAITKRINEIMKKPSMPLDTQIEHPNVEQTQIDLPKESTNDNTTNLFSFDSFTDCDFDEEIVSDDFVQFF